MKLLSLAFRLAAFAAIIFLAGCSAPKSVSEFRSWSRSSSYMKTKEYLLEKSTLASVEKKFRAFSSKCFQKELISKVGITGSYGTSSHTTISRYNPRIIQEPNRISLVIQREDSDSVGYPDGGVYEFLAEAAPAAKGVQVFTSTFSMRMPDRILNDMESWLKGEGKFCPF